MEFPAFPATEFHSRISNFNRFRRLPTPCKSVIEVVSPDDRSLQIRKSPLGLTTRALENLLRTDSSNTFRFIGSRPIDEQRDRVHRRFVSTARLFRTVRYRNKTKAVPKPETETVESTLGNMALVFHFPLTASPNKGFGSTLTEFVPITYTVQWHFFCAQQRMQNAFSAMRGRSHRK